MTDSKFDQLQALLRSFGSCLVAYSGGVDSVFLARVACDVLGARSLAVIADSPSLPRRELAEALEIAERFKIPVRIVQTAEFDVLRDEGEAYARKLELTEFGLLSGVPPGTT